MRYCHGNIQTAKYDCLPLGKDFSFLHKQQKEFAEPYIGNQKRIIKHIYSHNNLITYKCKSI